MDRFQCRIDRGTGTAEFMSIKSVQIWGATATICCTWKALGNCWFSFFFLLSFYLWFFPSILELPYEFQLRPTIYRCRARTHISSERQETIILLLLPLLLLVVRAHLCSRSVIHLIHHRLTISLVCALWQLIFFSYFHRHGTQCPID